MHKFIFTAIVLSTALFSANAQMPAVGTKATELNYKDPNGKEISLSSLKGNIVLIDFWASWCAPCRMVVPIIEEIASERPDIKVGKINVDEQPELASEFGIMSIPTLVVMKNGKIVQQVSGARPKEAILTMI